MRASNELYGHLVRPALLSALRTIPGDVQQFAAALKAIETGGKRLWDEFVFYATYHGVLGAIDTELTHIAGVSEEVREAVQRRRALEQLWHAHVVKGLEEAVRVLTGAGIDVCALKGPMLATRLYETPSARHCLDVDLLVRPTDVNRALSAFEAAGFVADAGESTPYLLEYGQHFSVTRSGTVAVELHFRPYAGFGVQLPGDLLLARAAPVPLTDKLSVMVLSPEDEFIYLAAHAAGHSFIRFVWLYDLKLFIRRYAELDWSEVVRRADAFGLTSVVAYTLRLMDRWLDVRIPNPPRALSRLGLRSRLADGLLTEASTPGDKSFRDNLSGLFFTSLLCENARDAAWLLHHHLWRATRRRLYRVTPTLLPDRWSW